MCCKMMLRGYGVLVNGSLFRGERMKVFLRGNPNGPTTMIS